MLQVPVKKRLQKLHEIRAATSSPHTSGLDDSIISKFLESDANLQLAIDEAFIQFEKFKIEFPTLMALPEQELLAAIQERILNFYGTDAVNPYVPLAARGPWIVSTHGAVVYDSGGYGMLGFGHCPPGILEAIGTPYPMANVMTASLRQYRFVERLRREIGHSRGTCPYAKFIFMNSGSEGVEVAARISDAYAKTVSEPGARYAGKIPTLLTLQGGFHGRAGRAGRLSDSSRKSYLEHLATYRGADDLIAVPPNDVSALERVFAEIEGKGRFIELLAIEPVMGEGNPGLALTPAFYEAARRLTTEHGALLGVDSIQAGLRTTGNLSIIDYPGFETLAPPDFEVYSKALNAGQVPLSVLALSEETAKLYRPGLYGNTMSGNPRAVDAGFRVLEEMTDEVRRNIVERGKEFVSKLNALKDKLKGPITQVQGCGLLISASLDESRFKVVGIGSTEEQLRLRGIGAIHGGKNALRFTPWFRVTSAEIDLIISELEHVLTA